MISLSRREREFRDGIDEVAIVRYLLEKKTDFCDNFCKNKKTPTWEGPIYRLGQIHWATMLQDPAIKDVTSTIGKRFR